MAFEHLELLAGLGLLVRGSRTGFPRRPARIYRAVGQAAEVSYPPRQYRLLAGAIRGGIERMRAGEAYGRRLAAGIGSEAEAMARLEALGVRYAMIGSRIQANNCVFREACDSAREVVCGVHAGLLKGALAASGVDRDATPTGPDASGGCGFEANLSGTVRPLNLTESVRLRRRHQVPSELH